MVSVPMLVIYNGNADTYIEAYTNASAKVLCAVLTHNCIANNHFHPVAYFSKKFNNM